MLVAHDVHLTSSYAHFHEFDKICPHCSPLVVGNEVAGALRIDSVTEEQFGAIHIANPGQHCLIHEKRTDCGLGLGDSCPGPVRVCCAPQRIGSETGFDGGYLRRHQNLARGGTTKVGAEIGTDHSHPNLPHRFFHRQDAVCEFSVQPEVYVDDQPVVVGVPEVFAPGIGRYEYMTVHQPRVLRESTLRTDNADW